MTMTIFDGVLKDLYPTPGTRIKQWVVDQRKEREWEEATCPRIAEPTHEDNTGALCRSMLFTFWIDREQHDCCSTCNDAATRTADEPDVAAWRTLKAARPTPTSDRSALSDEIAPDISPTRHPMLRGFR